MTFLTPKRPQVIIPPEPEPTLMPDPDDIVKRKRKEQARAQQYTNTVFEDANETRQTLG